MATYMGRDTSKLKAKGSNNKWKYMSEAEMLSIASKFSPYRYGTLRFTFPLPSYLVYSRTHIYMYTSYKANAQTHSSLFMWYMWRIEDVDISVMQS